jgi:hypothetical protein
MINHGTVVFRGASGEKYRFQVWPLGTKFRAAGAVCLFSKQSFPNRTFAQRASYQCICVGHTPDLSQLGYDLPQLSSADCVCVYLADEEQQRVHVQRDLLEGLGIWHENFAVDLSPGNVSIPGQPDK